MAQPANSGGGGGRSSSGGGESRALSSALSSASPFTGRATSMALHASDRHVDRWAPERNATSRSRGLGSLAFVDRLLQPWMMSPAGAPADRLSAGGLTQQSRQVAPVSWVFPRPWYQDELDWMAADREAQSQGHIARKPASMAPAGSLTTRGTYVTPQSVAAEQMATPMAPRFASSLEYVAPSMTAASGRSPAAEASARTAGLQPALPGTAPAIQRALRAWSPQVTFAAAQAAEVMAGTMALADSAGLTTAERSPVLEGLAYVTPAAFADATPEGARSAETGSPALLRTIAQLSAAQASNVRRAPEAPTTTTSTPTPTITSSPVAETAGVARSTAPTFTAAQTAVEDSFRAEQVRAVEEIRESRAAHAAERTAAPSIRPAPTPVTEMSNLAASSPAASHAMRTVELLARSALSGNVAPASGPRVAMPAGLGGAVVGAQAASAAWHPMLTATMTGSQDLVRTPDIGGDIGAESIAPARAPRARGFSPVWTSASSNAPAADGGGSALSAIAADRPAAMGHLAWADRWLARVAGASPASLAALDVGREHALAAPRQLSIGSPEVVYVLPDREGFDARDGRASPASPVQRSASLPSAARTSVATGVASAPVVREIPGVPQPDAVRPTEARADIPMSPRFDDADAVPDEVFAAIARGARPRVGRPETRTAPTASQTPGLVATSAPTATTVAAPPSRPSRPTLADHIAHSAPTAPTAGLHAGLASSPMAPALAGILPLPVAPMFDPRSMFGAGLVSAYVGGDTTFARDAGPAPRAGTVAAPAWSGRAGHAWLPRALSGLPFVAPWTSPGSFVEGQSTLERTPATDGGRLAARAPAPTFVTPDVARGTDDGIAASTPSPTSTPPISPPARVAAAGVPGARVEQPTWSVHSPALAPAALAAIDPIAAASLAGLPAELLRAYVTPPQMPVVAGDVAAPPTREATAAVGAGRRTVTTRRPDGSLAESPAALNAPSLSPMSSPMSASLSMVEPGTWNARPGMTAELAQGFAVSHERTAADLAFDFVPPELVLAARVYGFGAAEAAQAARLAVAGPAGLSAMASSLDLTFLRQLHVAAESGAPRTAGAPSQGPAARSGSRSGSVEIATRAPHMPGVAAQPGARTAVRAPDGSIITPPIGSHDVDQDDVVSTPVQPRLRDAVAATQASQAAAVQLGQVGQLAQPGSLAAQGALAPEMAAPGTVFGVPRRLPRGVFHWPPAVVAALDMRAELPHGAGVSTVAALELLAAGAVADMGALVSPWTSDADDGSSDAGFGGGPSARSARAGRRGGRVMPASLGAPEMTMPDSSTQGTLATLAPLGAVGDHAAPTAAAGEPGVAEVADSFAVPTAARTRFETIYLSLSRSPVGQSLSPSVRAARALAIVSGQDGATATSAQERARTAWSVMPVVFGSDPSNPIGSMGPTGLLSPVGSPVTGVPYAASMPTVGAAPVGAARGATIDRPNLTVLSGGGESEQPQADGEARPGLSRLAARAGEAIGSYVNPTSSEVSRASSGAARGKKSDARTERATGEPMVQELIRTGRTFSRVGGGETSIPSWFEAAARKMLEQRGVSETVSIADLTLVASAPSHAVAAASKGDGAPAAAEGPREGSGGGGGEGNKGDVDKIAADVYAAVLEMIAVARERSGDPWV